MENLEQLLVEIKKDEWANATVSLFVAKRQLRNKQAKYTVYQVNADDSLQLKLRNIANQILALWSYKMSHVLPPSSKVCMKLTFCSDQFPPTVCFEIFPKSVVVS